MRVIYYTASSLDGFIAGPGHELDWLMALDDTGGEGYAAFIAKVGAIAMGSHTYEWLLRNHIQPEGKPRGAWPYTQPTWVFSKRDLPRIEGADAAPDIRFVRGDVAAVMPEIRAAAGDRNLWVAGGGDLAGQFWDRGLLDEIEVAIAPVTLGAGYPLLPRRVASPPLRLLETRPTRGFVSVRYAVERG